MIRLFPCIARRAAAAAALALLFPVFRAEALQSANYDESKVAPYTLEDPLVFADGRKILANHIVLRDLTAAAERKDRAAIKTIADSIAKWRDEAFKKAVKGEKAQKALSIYMNQASGTGLLFTSNHVPFSSNSAMKNGLPAPHTLLGADMLVNRAFDENHMVQLIKGNGRTCHLEVSEDGKTAKVRTEMDTDLVFGGNGSSKDNPKSDIPIGKASIKEEFVFDLSGDMPKVTAIRLSRKFDA